MPLLQGVRVSWKRQSRLLPPPNPLPTEERGIAAVLPL
jgi:hypothetical protein